jgi:hypothetical protein
MKVIEENVTKMEAQLKTWGTKLEELAINADKAGTQATSEFVGQVKDLKAKHAATQAKLTELRAAGAEKWDTFWTGVDGAYGELAAAFQKLKS